MGTSFADYEEAGRPFVVPNDDLLVVDGYLCSDKCAFIANELRYVLWRGSEVVQTEADGTRRTALSDERTSTTASQRWFSKVLNGELKTIEERLVQDFGVATRYLERWQGVKYEAGERFGLHTDGGPFKDHPAGERVLTFLLCIQAPESGGETYFPKLDRLIEPKAGRLLVWNNLRRRGISNERFVHAATPARSGVKIILTTWSREWPVRVDGVS